MGQGDHLLTPILEAPSSIIIRPLSLSLISYLHDANLKIVAVVLVILNIFAEYRADFHDRSRWLQILLQQRIPQQLLHLRRKGVVQDLRN